MCRLRAYENNVPTINFFFFFYHKNVVVKEQGSSSKNTSLEMNSMLVRDNSPWRNKIVLFQQSSWRARDVSQQKLPFISRWKWNWIYNDCCLNVCFVSIVVGSYTTKRHFACRYVVNNGIEWYACLLNRFEDDAPLQKGNGTKEKKRNYNSLFDCMYVCLSLQYRWIETMCNKF